MNTAFKILDVTLMVIWIAGFFFYVREYNKMARAYNALTQRLLPLEGRIESLETLAVTPDVVDGFEF